MAFIKKSETEEEKAPRKPTLHDVLCCRAEKWLKNMGCGATVKELATNTRSGECPDAIGWRDGISILIEAKSSRSDFLADKKKPFRSNPELGMGDWRFYLCPPGIITADDLPEGWGLLYAHSRKIEKVAGVPPNTQWYVSPFAGNKRDETIVLSSALRRLK